MLLFALLSLVAADTSQTSIEGRWVNPDKTVIVDIAACAEAMCGTVQWASEQAQQDAKKGTPTLIGTQLLTGLQPKGKIWLGKLFVPDQKLHVTAKLESEGEGQLKVSGCALGGIVCDTQLWARADGPLPPAD
jgi:uncharacterized protein (DUF2147 family)